LRSQRRNFGARHSFTTVGVVWTYLGHDADGNLISQVDGSNSTTYTYDEENHLVSAVTPQGKSTYQYDPFGNLLAVTRDGQTTKPSACS
jgi:YD repeat-containing protein